MSVKLDWRKNKDGTQTPFLIIYTNRKRSYKFLPDFKKQAVPPLDKTLGSEDLREFRILRQQIIDNNAEMARAAELARAKESNDIILGNNQIKESFAKGWAAAAWMQNYVDKYQSSDKRNMHGVLNHFKQFLEKKRLPHIRLSDLTIDLIEEFRSYLDTKCSYSGAGSYFARFKKMLKHAFKEKLLNNNLATAVPTKTNEPKIRDVLTPEEINALKETPIINDDIRRAFLLTCSVGLRWCDVKKLTWGNINTYNKKIVLLQSKTKKQVVFAVNDYHIELLGLPGKPGDLVFDLPSANGCNKTLQAWVDRAGIKKKITWHCGRHSVGTNLITKGVGVEVVSKILGHTSLKHTMKYIQISESLIRDALTKLNY